MDNIFNLKKGDTIIVENGYCLTVGVYLEPKSKHGFYFYDIPWRLDTLVDADNGDARTHWIFDRLKRFKKGDMKPRKSSIQTRGDARVFPITEERLPQVAKDYIKFYKSYINNEYKNNRSHCAI